MIACDIHDNILTEVRQSGSHFSLTLPKPLDKQELGADQITFTLPL
jgi:hypothetical protein